MILNIHFTNLIIMCQVLLGSHMLYLYLEKREHCVFRIISSCILCLAYAYFLPVVNTDYILYGMFTYGSFFILAWLSLLISYQENIWNLLFCSVSGYTLEQLSSAVNELFMEICRFLGFTVPNYAGLLLTSTVVFVCGYTLLRSYLKRYGKISIHKKSLLLVSLIAIFVDILSGLIMGNLLQQNYQPEYRLLLLFYNFLACIFILCLQLAILSNKNLETELSIMSHMLSEEKKQYQMSKDNINLINLKCHDLKYQIRRIRNSQGEVDRAALQEIENEIGIYDSVARTGIPALDVILTEKSLICEKADISLTCMIEGQKHRSVADTDIYSLFGNALDNAIEAVRQLPDVSQRNISLNIKSRGKLLMIHVENAFSGSLEFEDDLPVTTKGNHDFHGFGMKSMRMIAEKYGGCLTASANNHAFHLKIMLPVE